MELYNTFSGKKEEFKQRKDSAVSFYACGPTVYDFAHIGNLRTYIFEDVLRRALSLSNFCVNHIMNITDLDDKVIAKSGAKKNELKKLAKQYEDAFINDIKKLNINLPNKFTKATEFVDQMGEMINILLKKGLAYKSLDGSVYYSISKFSDYGKLSKLNKDGIKSGVRADQDEYKKENPADFALWKAWSESDGDIFWYIPNLGKGRPGWHIECSAMSLACLGETIDIHAGAVDLIFPHHENEIAQSEGASGKKFVRFWVHGEHLLVDGKKMAKSAKNFYKLSDIEGRGFSPLDFRYLCLGAHYRSKLNFTWEGLESAKNSRERLNNIIEKITNRKTQITNKFQITNSKYQNSFRERVFDDLDMPGALAVMWEMMRDQKISNNEKMQNIAEFDKILGLNLFLQKTVDIPDKISSLAKKRDRARAEKNFTKSDQIREQIEKLGYFVEDTEGGSRVITQ